MRHITPIDDTSDHGAEENGQSWSDIYFERRRSALDRGDLEHRSGVINNTSRSSLLLLERCYVLLQDGLFDVILRNKFFLV